MFRDRSRLAWTAVLMLAIGLSPSQSPAQEYPRTTLAKEMVSLAQQIKDVLTKHKELTLELGEFRSRAAGEVDIGAGLQQKLRPELTRLDIRIEARAAFRLVADYQFKRSGSAMLERLEIKVELLKKNGDSVPLGASAVLTNDDMRDLTEVAGFTGRLSESADKPTRNKEFAQQREKPKVHLHGDRKTCVSSTPDSPYYVELLAGPPRNPTLRGVQVKDGQAFAGIERDEEYQIRIVNNSPNEVAVSVSVDGISVFAFSEDTRESGEPRYSHFILAARSSMIVPGWHKTADPKREDNYRVFLVTRYGEGAASLLKVKGQVGQIYVSFARSYDPSKDPPKSATETGFGRDIKAKQEVVQRRIDPPHDFVTIRYTRGVEPAK